MRLSKFAPLLAAAPFLGGCNLVVMNPAGDIASQQAELIIYSTILMLIVVLPVMALTVIFAIKYRSSNKDAEYQPDWHHSTSLEIVIWTVPMAIIMCLAGLTWVATHRLDPYSPLQRISAEKEIPEDHEPLVVQVVAMDWKWLFIYPEQGVAAVNELAAPVDRPIKFEITSSTVMNSFFVPALAGQIYAMAGMQTELNAVMNKEGVYEGFSSNYSGAGFSHMRFKFHSVDEKGFEDWVARAHDSGQPLDRAAFLKLDEPSIANPVSYYGSVDPELWNAVINLCVDSNDLCQNDMMMVDALGGGGLEGLQLREVFAGICSSSNPTGMLSRIRGNREVTQADGQPEPLSLAAIDLSGLLQRSAGSPRAGPESGTQPDTGR